MSGTPDVVAERDGVVAGLVADDEDVRDAAAFLDRAEADAGAPLVDEAERERLRGLEAGGAAPGGWSAVVARRQGRAVGYGGLVVAGGSGAPGTEGVGDAAVDRGAAGADVVLDLLLDALTRRAAAHGAGSLQVWLRQATTTDVAVSEHGGFAVARRLAVMGRPLDGPLPEMPPSPATVRAYRPGDDEQVVAVLAAAYAGTDEAGWDLGAWQERTRLPWFRPEDLLVAELPAGEGAAPWLGGLHWLKRRDERLGEVYNLAIHPDAQGTGLGSALLAAGLAHLSRVGCDEVWLWVDLANDPAVRLYASQGFRTLWEDVALARPLGAAG